MTEKQETDYVCHGSDWPEHEDFLVGNRKGLEKLQSAISEALEKGESSIDAGEFVGVRRIDTDFFENQQNNVSTTSSIVGWLVVIAIVAVFLVGIGTIFSWWSA